MKSSLKKIFALTLAILTALSLITVSFAAYKGDVDGDNDVDSTDALIVLRYSVKSYDKELDLVAADMDGNNEINSTDALKILRISVNLDEKIEIPEEPTDPIEPTVPTTKEEIAEAYNNAVNKAVDEKAGYKKARTTSVTEMNGPDSLMSLAEEPIKEFLGDGTKQYTNTKGSAKYFGKASLTADDLNSATCTLDGDNIVITLNVKSGESSATKSTKKDNSALARSGLITGKNADPDYDYLSSEGIYAAVTSASSSLKVESISSQNTNVKIVAVVNAATGKLVSLTTSYDWTVVMTKIKFSFLVNVDKADGKAKTAVELSDFEW